MQTFFKNDFRIATLVAWLIANVVFFWHFLRKLASFRTSHGVQVFFFTITFQLQLLLHG